MDCVNPKTIWPHRSVEWCDANEEYPVQVPCGKCVACLVNKRNDWSFRLEQEWKVSSSSKFITLTYDEKHLRTDRSLRKRDVQLFMKRLRKRNGTRIRYYAVGEYGGKSNRPHYHVLLFNCESDQYVTESWRDSKDQPIGFVHFGKVTEASIAYCTKYIIQRTVEGPGDLEPPFALMSRAYAIGGNYLTDAMVQWHRDNDANYAMRYGVKVRLPRFYKSKIWYSVTDRERVSKAALLDSVMRREKQMVFLKKKYGDNWKVRYEDMRDSLLAGVKQKIAFTQSI